MLPVSIRERGFFMEFNMALCEASRDDLDKIKNVISNRTNKKINIIEFSNSKEINRFLEKNKVDICFLDIDYYEEQGLEIVAKIKKLNKKSIIIFLSKNEYYVMEAFKLRVFNYLIIPLTEDIIFNLWEDINERLEEIDKLKKYDMELSISNKENVFKVKYENILYFEKNLRKIKVVCDDKIIEYYGAFKDLCKSLDTTCFTQCHQSFIVNNDKISEYSNQSLYLQGCGNGIPVSKAYIKDVRRTIEKK